VDESVLFLRVCSLAVERVVDICTEAAAVNVLLIDAGMDDTSAWPFVNPSDPKCPPLEPTELNPRL
jgi:hypothetical protein